MPLSQEAINTLLFVQVLPVLSTELTAKPRTRRLCRHPLRRIACGAKNSRIPDTGYRISCFSPTPSWVAEAVL